MIAHGKELDVYYAYDDVVWWETCRGMRAAREWTRKWRRDQRELSHPVMDFVLFNHLSLFIYTDQRQKAMIMMMATQMEKWRTIAVSFSSSQEWYLFAVCAVKDTPLIRYFFSAKFFFRLYRLCWYYWLTGSETEVRQYKVANERRSKYPSADVLLSVLDVFPVCYEDDDDAEWNGSRMIHRKEKRPEGKLFLSFSATLLWVSDWRRILCSVKSFSSRLYCRENCMQMRILMQCMDKSWTTDTSHPPLPSSVSTFFESSSLFPALSLSLPLRWLYVSDSLDD